MDDRQTKQALELLCSIGFDTIRICNYWNRIEKRGRLDLAETDWQLDIAARYNRDVILTVGIKTPRWPEFFYPDEVLERFPDTHDAPDPVEAYPELGDLALEYVSAFVDKTRHHPAISYYQIGNESLNPVEVSDLHYLNYAFVEQEVELVRSLKKHHQKILLTNSIGGPSTDERFHETLDLNPDAIGINAYYRSAVPIPEPLSRLSSHYFDVASAHWDKQIVAWQKEMTARNIEPVVAEVQAEPWELGKEILGQALYPSANPKDSIALAAKLQGAGYFRRIFWGAEYWVAHDWKFGGQLWLKAMRDYADEYQPA